MADYETRTVVTTRREFVLQHGYRKPIPWVEISKVMAGIRNELISAQGHLVAGKSYSISDDAVMVTATDEEIIFYYETEERRDA